MPTIETTTTTTRCLPTIPQWLDATERAARLGVRLLILDSGAVAFFRAAGGRPWGGADDWDAAVDWIDRQERDEWRRAA